MTDIRRWVVSGLFGAVLVMTVLRQAAPDVFDLWTMCLLYLGFAVCAVATSERFGDSRDIGVVALQALLGLGIAWIILRQWRDGIPATDRVWHVTVVFGAVAGFPLVTSGVRRYLRANAVYLLGFVAVLGVYLRHTASLASGSGLASFPVFSGVVFALGLLVAPRYVSREDFLWLVAGLSAVVVGIGLPSILVGAYTLGPTTVEPWRTPVGFLGISTGVPAMRSVFRNPNTLGIVAFAGTVSALVLLGDAVERRRGGPGGSALTRTGRRHPFVGAAALFLGLGIVGLVLSGSRASILAAGASATLYLASVGLGGRGQRYGFVAVVGGVALALWAVSAGALPIGDGNRFALWAGGVEAVARSPSPFGYGMVSGAEVIEPYVVGDAAGHSPHNSYLSTFIRVGLVGGAGYLLLTVGNVIDGAVGYPSGRRVDPGLLGLATGFAIHQLFESYSLFGFWTGSVLATLAAGYLLVSRVEADPLPAKTTFRWNLVSRPPEPARPPRPNRPA